MKISPLSSVLVLLQFSCLGGLLFTGPVWPRNTTGILLLTMSFGVALATTYAFRQSKLTVFPEPRAKAQLITNGIFAYIRHPYYAAVLLFAFSLLATHFSYMRLTIVVVLALVLVKKMVHEEKLLCQFFPDYPLYQQRSKKLIPWLW